MRKNKTLLLILLLSLALALVACGPVKVVPESAMTLTPSPTATAIPTITPNPPATTTPDALPTSEPTATPALVVFAAPVTDIWPVTVDGSLPLWLANGPFDGEPVVMAPPEVFQPAGGKACGMKKIDREIFLLSCDNGQPGGHAFRFADVTVPEPANSLIKAGD